MLFIASLQLMAQNAEDDPLWYGKTSCWPVQFQPVWRNPGRSHLKVSDSSPPRLISYRYRKKEIEYATELEKSNGNAASREGVRFLIFGSGPLCTRGLSHAR